MATRERPTEQRTWFRGDAVLAAALVLIALQLVWKYDLVSRTYFRQDDFHYIIRGLENAFTWDYLMWVDVGHLLPGGFGISWLMGRLGGYNDAVAHGTTIVLQAAASLALLRLLRLMFGSRPAILIPLGFYVLTPMTIPSLSWWAAVLETLPLQLALPMALHAHVLFVRNGRFRHVLAACAWTLFGLVFFVKAPFIPILLFAVTAFWLTPGPWWKAPFTALRRQWKAWLPYLVILAGYAYLFFVQLYSSVQVNNAKQTPQLPDSDLALQFGWYLTSRSLIPSAIGGPWRWQGVGDDYAMPWVPDTMAYASLGVAAVVVLASSLYRRRAWAAWLIVALYFVSADIIPVVLGRITQMGLVAGSELRYVAATAMVLAIFLALAFIPLDGERDPWLRALPDRGVTGFFVGSLAGAFALGSIWSVQAYGDRPLGAPAKSFVETAAVALKRAPKGSAIVDRPIPRAFMEPTFFWKYANASNMLRPVTPPGITWVPQLDGQFTHALIFDKEGRLLPADVGGFTSTLPRTGCQRLRNIDIVFPLPQRLVEGHWTVQIIYLNGSSGRVSATLGRERKEVEVSAGLASTFSALHGNGREVRLRAVEGKEVCVSEVKVGVIQPSPNGTPSPLNPVKP